MTFSIVLLTWAMKSKLFISILILFHSSQGLTAPKCKLTYFNKNSFEKRVDSIPEMRDFSRTVNNILKKSYNTLQKVDDKTLGLVSAIASGGIPIDQLKPEQWDKLNITGNLIYQDQPFSGTALKGTKMTFSEKTNSRTITTGAFGEFSESFSKLIPFTKFRLFPIPFVYSGNNLVPTIKIPITVKVESTICQAEMTIQEIPLEPLLLS